MKGAHVHIVYLNPNPSGAKTGLDDFLAAGGTVAELLDQAKEELSPLPDEVSADTGPYLATPAGFVYRRDTRDGPVVQFLSNFTAHIVEEVIADDGASERTEIVIAGELNGELLPPVRVPARRFASLDWVNSEWGPRPIISAGFGNRDRVREAIQRHSTDIALRRIYEHPGWRQLPEHGWCYLHADGAIGAGDPIAGVEVVLSGAARRILLPTPPDGDDLRGAIRVCLSLLDLAPDRITAPLFGTVYRALLCEFMPVDVSVFPIGPTGAFKSELSALVMQHVGPGFDRLHLPAHWSGTDNSLERSAFDFKDAPFVIDDFAPTGSSIDVARLHAKADRIFRGVGNRGSRGRMSADGKQRPDLPPRGMVISTGEDAPRGQSQRARMMILDVAPGDVDRQRLTAAQVAAGEGILAAATAGCIQWLAPQLDALRTRLPELFKDFRAQALHGAHARTPEAVAHLALGWWAFLRFAVEVGPLTREEAQQTFDRVWKALGEAANRQSDYQNSEEPAQHFLDLLEAALAAGHVHFASPTGRVPPTHPEAWGWREERVGTGEYERSEWKPKGDRAGWIEGAEVYVDLDAALAGIRRVSQATGNGIAIAPKTLAKRLDQRGFLRSTDRERRHLKVRRTLEGRRRAVLHLPTSIITRQEVTRSAQSTRDDSDCAQEHGVNGNTGSISWADSPLSSAKSTHESKSKTARFERNESVGPIGSIVEARHRIDADEMHLLRPAGPDDVLVGDEAPPW
jgi:hypothetical protein